MLSRSQPSGAFTVSTRSVATRSPTSCRKALGVSTPSQIRENSAWMLSSMRRLRCRKVNGPMPSTLTVKLDAAEGVAMISPIECGNSRHQGGYGVRQKASGSDADHVQRSEEHTYELQSLMRNSCAGF